MKRNDFLIGLTKLISRVFAFVFVLGCVVNATQISRQEAIDIALGYAKYSSNKLLDGTIGFGIKEVNDIVVEYNGEKLLLAYVVSFNPEGWIIITAHDEMDPIQGFSAIGDFGDAHTNEASPVRNFLVSQLLGQYRFLGLDKVALPMSSNEYIGKESTENKSVVDIKSQNLAKRRKYSLSSDEEILEPMASPLGESDISDIRVPALLETKWGQGGYGENYYTPNNYVCGCTQTALGQIFYYHKWPQDGIGIITNKNGSLYYSDGSYVMSNVYPENKVYSTIVDVERVGVELATRGGDGNGGAYAWDKMRRISSGLTTEEEKQAKGALLYDIGIINGASYRRNGTSAAFYQGAIMSVFKYENIRCTKISNIATTNMVLGGEYALKNSLNANLDAGYPCSIEGWVLGDTSVGHAVVVDGYGFQDGETYYHINMGWAGRSDGYYKWHDWGYVTNWVYFNIFPHFRGEIISGRVLDKSGNPLANVNVAITVDGTNVIKRTNERGIWAYAGIKSGTKAKVKAIKDGIIFEEKDVEVGFSDYKVGPQVQYANCGNVWGIDIVEKSSFAELYGETVSTQVVVDNGSEFFSIVINNPKQGVYYTPFVSSTLEGDFVAASSSIALESCESLLTISIETQGNPIQFVKIGASDIPVEVGEVLQR